MKKVILVVSILISCFMAKAQGPTTGVLSAPGAVSAADKAKWFPTSGSLSIADTAAMLTPYHGGGGSGAIDTLPLHNQILAKSDTSSITQQADYVIEKVGSTIYARAAYKSGLPSYSNSSFNTVITSAMGNLVNGGKVFIGKGLFDNLDAGITIPHDNISIIGFGKRLTILKLKNNADASISYGTQRGLFESSVSGFTIKEVELDGNGANQTYIDNGSTSTARLCGIKLGVYGSPDIRNILIDNCYIHDYTFLGVFSNQAVNVILSNSDLYNNYWNGVTVNGDSTVITNCNVWGSADTQISLFGNYNTIQNSFIGSGEGNHKGSTNGTAGIQIEANSSPITYPSYNRIINVEINGFYAAGSGSDTLGLKYGLHITNGRYTIVDNIRVRNVSQNAFGMFGATNTSVKNSFFIGSPDVSWMEAVGIYGSPVLTLASTNNTFQNNTIDDGHGTMMAISNYDVDQINNVFENNRINGQVLGLGNGFLKLKNNFYAQNQAFGDTIVSITANSTDTFINKTIAAGSNTISGLTNANLSGTAAITGGNLSSTIAIPSGATATTQTAGNSSTSIATTAFATAADNVISAGLDTTTGNSLLNSLQAMGSKIRALPIFMPENLYVLEPVQINNHEAAIIKVRIPKAQTITGLNFIQSVQGVFTGVNFCGVGLYTLSGTTLTKVASSTSNTTLFKAVANTFVSVPFSSTYSAAKGIYYAVINYNSSAETTGPKLAGKYYNTTILATLDLPAGQGAGGVIFSSSSSLPSTMDITTTYNLNTVFWAALY